MGKNKKKTSAPPLQNQGGWSRVPVGISVVALVVSGLSWREARQARELSYLTSRPAVSATVELVEQIQPGKPVVFRVVLENRGASAARKLNPELRFLFSPPSEPFRADYSAIDDFGKAASPGTVSELNPGAKTTLVSTSSLSLSHDHDVEAVTSGERLLYLYGRARYVDVYDQLHELRFCSYYRPVVGVEPLKLVFCSSYNETVDL
jgi:hypothetical protein